jgi:hypothetical protein
MANWQTVQATDAKVGFIRQVSGFRHWITPDGVVSLGHASGRQWSSTGDRDPPAGEPGGTAAPRRAGKRVRAEIIFRSVFNSIGAVSPVAKKPLSRYQKL